MDAQELYGFGAHVIAARAGVSLPTARRWKRARTLNGAIARLLRLVLFGELGEISRAWRGWSLRDGEITSPEGWGFKPGEICAIPFFRAQLAAYQAEQRLPRQGDFIEGRFSAALERRAGDRRRRSG